MSAELYRRWSEPSRRERLKRIAGGFLIVAAGLLAAKRAAAR